MIRSNRGSGPIRRAPFRAWLVTGPIGRLTGFLIEFVVAVWALAAEWRRR
jgi:hypothetical protein